MILRTELSRTLYGVRVIRMSSARKDNMLLKTPFFLYIFTINAQLATPNANKIAEYCLKNTFAVKYYTSVGNVWS